MKRSAELVATFILGALALVTQGAAVMVSMVAALLALGAALIIPALFCGIPLLILLLVAGG